MKQIITLKDLVVLAELEGLPQETVICMSDEDYYTLFTDASVVYGENGAEPVIELR